MIEVLDVRKDFGDFTALDDINIRIKKGTIHGIIGENGAGKTTLLQILAGIYDTKEGKVLVEGEEVYDNNKVKHKIGYVGDRNQYFKDYKIREIVEFYSGIYENFSKTDFQIYNKIFRLNLDKKIKQLSKGMQMRLSLMLNLSIRPEILILDEPTSGLDAIVKKDLLDILIDQVHERELTIVISSHHISELEKICDEITILNKGKIKYQSNIDEIKENVKKLQVVFEGDVEKEIHQLENIIDIEKIGSVYYLVTDNYGEVLIADLKEIGAQLIENIGITLEEVFVYTSKIKEGSGIDE
ncbi:ABC transporter ATP-binding protein [Tissierella pigra]|uniref:ABC transporter ATP-binding protein n=1 Tax=Tissierella pigra TaxID=2607614 RepID=A0A6N7Y4Z6_9FIRM|nr:ABC transporter ATP-binding protein [Tissierella pigra]MBU5427042.1 ABC transporter ATP-binding protein [Tissierella pigra]MSU03120.1 ABC transporter ATP-binding protein [Tissierella pigra]